MDDKLRTEEIKMQIDYLLAYHKFKDVSSASKKLKIAPTDLREKIVKIVKPYYKKDMLPIDFIYIYGDTAENELYNIIVKNYPNLDKEHFIQIMTSSDFYHDGMSTDKYTEQGYISEERSRRRKAALSANRNSFLVNRLDELFNNFEINTTVLQVPKTTKTSSNDCHVYLISDIELGQYIAQDDIGGNTEFNSEIAFRRMENFKDKMVEIYEQDPCSSCHIILIGDIVRGLNNAGAWNPAYINEHIMDQVDLATKMIVTILAQANSLYTNLAVTGVIGNHGRAGKYNEEHYKANWDMIVYRMAQRITESVNTNIAFNFPPTWYALQDLAGIKAIIVHGDDCPVQGANGLNAIRQKLNEWLHCTKISDNIDIVIMGHWHQPIFYSGKVIVNGSWSGGDVYSSKNLKVAHTPSQVFFSVRGKDITCFREIRLT